MHTITYLNFSQVIYAYFTYHNSSQVILSSLEHGVREGRILLHQWLVNLTAQYNDAFKIAEYRRGSLNTVHVDVAFTQCPQLQPLPRLVFALLRNPLLRFHEEGVHPDYRIYLQCLFRYEILFSVDPFSVCVACDLTEMKLWCSLVEDCHLLALLSRLNIP